MGVGYNTSIVRDGLVLYLDAANSKSYPGSGNWKDLIDTTSAAVVNGTPSFDSTDLAFVFDSSSDFFRLTRDDLNGGSQDYDEVTVNIWFYATTANTGSGTSRNLITVENSFEVSIGTYDTSNGNVYYASNPWAWRGTNEPSFKFNTWNMMTFVHSLSHRALYINGEEIYYSTNSGALSAGSSSYPYMTISGRTSGTGSPFFGKIATVQIYDRPISTDEIVKNFEALRGRYGI